MNQINTQIKKIDALFQEAFHRRASDLHLAVDFPPTIRIDGQLVELTQYPKLTPKDLQELILSILTKSEQEYFIKDRELDLSYELPGLCRFRVNIHWERDHMGMVARVVSNQIPTMEELTFPEVVYKLIRGRQGLVLVTGPTGCGKSTSLAAMIDLINTEQQAHIVTLEDPIEYIHASKRSLIRQRQLHSDFLSFPEALKHVVRQDPNVIMVGEMRDLETIAAAITIAETGHLVLATLHTMSAAETIDRIVDIFPPHQQEQIRVQLSLELRGIISQLLLPKMNGGRVAAREILLNTPAVSNLIRENKISQIKLVIQTNSAAGMQTMDQD
ncbi:MAG TPA: PilT/PilU family type 4a pilus ATPase, partial [Patescibacteria group bacterium]|nr:PilT/PilU family type 4a pilus ATPase [Patescibacteria group bacterium]